MGSVHALDSLLRDPRLWRGQQAPTPSLSKYPTGCAALDQALPTGGWPEASLVEVLFSADGLGELSLLLPALAALSAQDKPIVVIAPPYRLYAPAWQRAGVCLTQLQVIDANGKDALWAMEQSLRAGCCGAVIGWPLRADDNALRRLQVAAETGQTLGFVFRPISAQGNPSPAPLRLSLRGSGDGVELRVLKCRGALPPARPIPFRH
ncbi:MAG: translesion DNA synthesis-associated protein ImuA [Arenimonas sp.]